MFSDGFDELDVVGPYEALAAAGQRGADCSVRLVTLTAGTGSRRPTVSG